MRKRSLALILSLAMVLTFTGCGTSKKGNSDSEGEIKLPKYTGVEIYESDIAVTDEEMEQTINSVLEAKATTDKKTSGTVKETDTITIDYVGKIDDGFEFEGGTGSDYSLDIDNNSFIEGFASGLVGKKIGKTVDLKLKFPDDYSGKTKNAKGKEVDLAGKDVIFTVTIKSKDDKKVPKLDDAFVESYFSGCASTADEFKTFLKRQVQIGKAMNNVVWQKLMDDTEVVSYNKKEVESYKGYLSDTYLAQIQQMGADLDTYLEACSMSQEDWDKDLKNNAEKAMKQQMLVLEIAKAEKLTIKEGSDAYKEKGLMVAQLNGVDTMEALELSYSKEIITFQLNYTAVQEFIFDNLKVKEGDRPVETTAAVEETTVAQ